MALKLNNWIMVMKFSAGVIVVCNECKALEKLADVHPVPQQFPCPQRKFKVHCQSSREQYANISMCYKQKMFLQTDINLFKATSYHKQNRMLY